MTSQSPRIYTYKITFEEVPYYYYGSKKEKYYNQPYMGSPTTHKWCWELYTPKKQILEIFDYTDEGWSLGMNEEHKIKCSTSKQGKKWWNDGCGNTKFDIECPGEGWFPGRGKLPRKSKSL